jgi:hypothetical protein
MTPFEGWENFYVIVGSSAGALIGLQFVVLTLISASPSNFADARAANAFATPTVVHFGVVLLLSAVVTAPWIQIGFVAALWGILGLGGLVYTLFVTRRMQQQNAYQPVLEDWVFHAVLPGATYAMLAASALAASLFVRPARFVVGAAALLLLFIGIHNAWDTVTYHVFVKQRERQSDESPQ